MNPTINILVRNNEETIEESLKSLLGFSKSILIGDAGGNDNSIKICKKYCSNIMPINFKNNYSDAKNQMIDKNSSWMFFVEPWEKVVSYKTFELKENRSYKVNLIKNDLITKETRIWHKKNNLKFKNPVFESVEDSESVNVEIYLTGENNNTKEKIDILKKWHEQHPIENEPLYFLSFIKLSEKNWTDFLRIAETYLYKEKNNKISTTMTKYYISMVRAYIESEKDYNKSVKKILECIKENPLMAEFWCLLGDIFFTIKDYEKAICFYENAIILGKYRIKQDKYPIEISKYKNYPEQMIESCKKIKSSLREYKKI